MKSRAGGGARGADRYARATALVRALTGVQDARIEADTNGIRTIVVTAEPGASSWEVTRNVQSALLASLGLAIDRAAVRVCSAGQEPSLSPGTALATSPAPVRVAVENGNGKTNGNGKATSPAGIARTVMVGEVTARAARDASIARLELERRPDGQLACRVVLALAGRIAAGEAQGEDTTRGRLETAARAVIAAGPAVGAELDGVQQVVLSGRDYVMVAVRSWSGHEPSYRAGTAALEASPEAAAARAALQALVS